MCVVVLDGCFVRASTCKCPVCAYCLIYIVYYTKFVLPTMCIVEQNRTLTLLSLPPKKDFQVSNISLWDTPCQSRACVSSRHCFLVQIIQKLQAALNRSSVTKFSTSVWWLSVVHLKTGNLPVTDRHNHRAVIGLLICSNDSSLKRAFWTIRSLCEMILELG